MHVHPRFTGRMALATLVLLSPHALARAATVPYTEALLSTYNPAESATPIDVHSAPAGPSQANYARSGDWGSVAGFASANLAAGQLKARAANSPLAGYSPYMQSNAWFGDGFRASDPSGPFSWTPESLSRFNLDLTGSAVTSPKPLHDLGYGNVGAFVLLSIDKPGTLNPDSPLVGGDNNIAYYLYLLGNPNQHLTYVDNQGRSQPLVATGVYNDLSSDIHIAQDFQPGGDFDWSLLIGMSGQITGPDFYDIDLSHTLTLSYSGPAGSTTASSSGLFQNFSPIPEPTGTLPLVAVPLLALRRPARPAQPRISEV